MRNTKKDKKKKKKKKVSRMDKWDKLYLNILRLGKSQEETDKLIKSLQESQKKTDEELKKTDELIKALRESQKKTDEQLEKTDEQIKNLGKQVGDLTNSQGLFWESLSREGIRKFLQDSGYDIIGESCSAKRKTKSGDRAEFDLVFEAEKDGEIEIFIVEVKSTAKPEDIKKFTKRLKKIFEYFPHYEGKKVWGLFSSGRYADGTDEYAIREGLVVFGISGDVLVLLNPPQEIKPFIVGSL